MNLVKYNPFNSFLSLDRTFDSLLKSSVFNNRWESDNWMPQADIVETDDQIKIQLDCPGISPENLKVEYKNNFLTISGEKKNEVEKKDSNYHTLERSYGKFTRTFSLGYSNINEDSIQARYENGVVNIEIEKTETNKSKNIEIQTIENSKLKALSASG